MAKAVVVREDPEPINSTECDLRKADCHTVSRHPMSFPKVINGCGGVEAHP